MKPSIRRQRGIGVVQLLFYAALIVAISTILLKLGPHYKEYLEVRSVMQDMKEDPELAGASRLNLAKALGNRLYVNYIKSVNAKDFKFKKTDKGYDLSVKYQVKEHLFGNVDVIMTFDHVVQLGKT